MLRCSIYCQGDESERWEFTNQSWGLSIPSLQPAWSARPLLDDWLKNWGNVGTKRGNVSQGTQWLLGSLVLCVHTVHGGDEKQSGVPRLVQCGLPHLPESCCGLEAPSEDLCSRAQPDLTWKEHNLARPLSSRKGPAVCGGRWDFKVKQVKNIPWREDDQRESITIWGAVPRTCLDPSIGSRGSVLFQEQPGHPKANNPSYSWEQVIKLLIVPSLPN